MGAWGGRLQHLESLSDLGHTTAALSLCQPTIACIVLRQNVVGIPVNVASSSGMPHSPGPCCPTSPAGALNSSFDLQLNKRAVFYWMLTGLMPGSPVSVSLSTVTSPMSMLFLPGDSNLLPTLSPHSLPWNLGRACDYSSPRSTEPRQYYTTSKSK